MQVVKGEGGFQNVLAVLEVLVLRGQDGQERGLGRRVEGSVPREACTWLGAWPGGQGGPGACRGRVSGDEGDSEGLGVQCLAAPSATPHSLLCLHAERLAPFICAGGCLA